MTVHLVRNSITFI